MTTRLLQLAGLVLVLSSVCFAQDAETGAWKAFLDWCRSVPAVTDPGALSRAYQTRLKAGGVADGAARETVALLQSSVARHARELTAVHFDRVYASPTPVFGVRASAYLVRTLGDRKPGTALDVAMGQGRNALYLASLGWDVTGYDISEGGLAAAHAEAARQGLAIRTVKAGHEEFDFGTGRWDLVVMTYAAAPMDDPGFIRRVRDSLRPGGLVVVEQFNAPPESPANKGPTNALFKSFEGLRVVHYEHTVDRSEWGGFLCRIGRITAQKD
jgi:2-polyprenyl-3-methyl-5-hydroxy-6-metoxy-1,4-benzoquinol methylase